MFLGTNQAVRILMGAMSAPAAFDDLRECICLMKTEVAPVDVVFLKHHFMELQIEAAVAWPPMLPVAAPEVPSPLKVKSPLKC